MRVGLRLKSAVALAGCVLLVLALATLAGLRAVSGIEENLGSAFARNVTQLNRQRILAPVERELALSQRLAGSEVTRRWLLDENDPAKRALFFAEAEGYRGAFGDGSYFVISESGAYYFNDRVSPASQQARYSLRRDDPDDAWFFKTIGGSEPFNINVNTDTKLKVTKVWFNVLVRDGSRSIGLAGTGLDLTSFLGILVRNGEAGVTPVVVNRDGAIQAHPNSALIDYSSITKTAGARSSLERLLAPTDAGPLRAAMREAERDPGGIRELWATMDGKRQLVSLAFVPELSWFVVTAVDLKAARVLDTGLLLPLGLALLGILAVLLLVAAVAIDRVVVGPIIKLTASARRVAAGDYALALPRTGNDELGDLTSAFSRMAQEVRSHTTDLEARVEERTRQLRAANERMAETSKLISDSIRYASLIQGAMLPQEDLRRAFPAGHLVIWQPRDVVGGDFYVLRETPEGCLAGVVDCAGHGVPGAFMTMIARNAIDNAIDEIGPADPAALLAKLDERVRARLSADAGAGSVATDIDAGLAYLDRARGTITFAGARTSLYCCDGKSVGAIEGDRRPAGGKRAASFTNRTLKVDPAFSFYLTTDGLLDQAGGPRGFGFGEARFREALLRHHAKPLEVQREALLAELRAYQGEHPQRDDITLLGFRPGPVKEANGPQGPLLAARDL